MDFFYTGMGPCLMSCLWWRHQIEIFSALLELYAGNSPVTDEFPTQRPVTRSFDIFFDLRHNKRFNSKQPRRWWFETPPRSLWRHCDANMHADVFMCIQFHFTNELFLFSSVSVLCYNERHLIEVNRCGCSRALYDKLDCCYIYAETTFSNAFYFKSWYFDFNVD